MNVTTDGSLEMTFRYIYETNVVHVFPCLAEVGS